MAKRMVGRCIKMRDLGLGLLRNSKVRFMHDVNVIEHNLRMRVLKTMINCATSSCLHW